MTNSKVLHFHLDLFLLVSCNCLLAAANISQLAGEAYVSNQRSGYNVTLNLTATDQPDDCPALNNAGALTQTQLIESLTDGCRYDRLEPPSPLTAAGDQAPVSVYTRLFIYILNNLDSSDLQFSMQALLQLRYNDPRLAFDSLAPQRRQPIMGETSLMQRLWLPHIYLANEQSSSILGANQKDVLTTINPDGTVLISVRIQATLYCWMNFKKFPFDEQQCATILESWMYNTSLLQLHWEPSNPLSFDKQLQLTEYDLLGSSYNESVSVSNARSMTHGALAGNYSTLSFNVVLAREVGYYIMDYFLPSIMIVAISWVSFWLQADQTPARTTLGCTTLLSFITLSQSQEKNLSKVSYITMSEVWFLVCTFFIFGSLVEFAFVNTIWRRNNNLELKKRTTKYIVKSTFVPNLKRHRGRSFNRSSSNLSTCSMDKTAVANGNGNGLSNTVITIETPIIIAESSLSRENSTLSLVDGAGSDGGSTAPLAEQAAPPQSFATMTPKEVSLWIDRKMRFVFPLAFIVFNALFWTLVYCL